jgi:hypothetical protein
MIDSIRNWPGYTGAFTRNEVLGAWRNGTRVVKQKSEAGDAHPDGSLGTVLGSMADKKFMDGLVFYFIEWDAKPRFAVGTVGWKVMAVV